MITMLHYDALQNPIQPNRKGAATSLGQAQAYLEQHPYEAFEENELVDVCLKHWKILALLKLCYIDHRF